MLKLTQQEFETVPLIIKFEILVAAVTCMWGKDTSTCLFAVDSSCSTMPPQFETFASAGSLIVSGNFKPVSALKNQRQDHDLCIIACSLLLHTWPYQPQLLLGCCRGLDANTLRVDFMSLNHRGQVLPMAAPAFK